MTKQVDHVPTVQAFPGSRRGMQIEFLWLSQRSYARGYSLSASSLNALKVWHLHHGSVRLRAPGGVIRWQAPGWVVPGLTHSGFDLAPGTRLTSLAFVASDDYRPLLGAMPPLRLNQVQARRAADITAAIGALVGAPADAGADPYANASVRSIAPRAHLQGRLFDMLGLLAEAGSQGDDAPGIRDPRVRLAAHMLAEAAHDRFPDKEVIASACGCSWRRIEQLFRHSIGQSPFAWFEARRLQYVQNRLLLESEPIKAIAGTSGFASVAHFCTWFRGKTGTTPGRFRNTHSLV